MLRKLNFSLDLFIMLLKENIYIGSLLLLEGKYF